MRYVLAINPTIEGFGTHDPAAALFVDGDPVFAVEEGRLIGRKRAPETFPAAAIGSCLDHAGIDGSAIDRVVVPWKAPIGAEHGSAGARRRYEGLQRAIAGAVGRAPSIERVNHHRSHAASAFGPSGFDEALVVTIDGRGGRDSTAVWHGVEGELERIRRYEAPNSLGYLYAAVAGYLGFQPFGGEGKVMGLAPYGATGSDIGDRFRDVVRGGVDYDVSALVGSGVPTAIARLERLFDAPRASSPASFDADQTALARTVQAFLEETVVAICEAYCAELAVDRVCLAGGVARNCKLNQRLAASSAVSELFVQPVAHDAGAALGAALAATDARSLPETVFLGPAVGPDAVDRFLDRRSVEYSVPDDPAARVASALAEGALVGWFRGRLELGPRALGNRSILADPRAPGARSRINGFVKGRAAWRPFAPSVPLESAGRYFEGPMPAPYMVRTVDVAPERRGEIPAALHPGDGTARPQTVTEAQNPAYHRLLEAFGERTGVPALLNTSFNESGDPIVATPADALEVFERTGLDLLVLEGRVVESSDPRR